MSNFSILCNKLYYLKNYLKKQFYNPKIAFFAVFFTIFFSACCYAAELPKMLDKNQEILLKKAYAEVKNNKIAQARKTILKINDPASISFINMLHRIKSKNNDNKYTVNEDLLQKELKHLFTNQQQVPKALYSSKKPDSIMRSVNIEIISNEYKKAKNSKKEQEIVNAQEKIRSAWRTGKMTTSEESNFFKNFGHMLTQNDRKIRIDNFIYSCDKKRAKALLKTLKGEHFRITKLALDVGQFDNIKEIKQIQKTLNAGKKKIDINNSVLQYEIIKWLKNHSKDSEAISELIKTNLQDNEKNDAWWMLARYFIRDLLTKNSTKTMNKWAYILATKYCPKNSADGQYIDAEWTAGWIALRFLKIPHVAYSHFTTIYISGRAKTIYSLSRSAYWAAKASEDMGNYKNAEQWFNIASSFSTTFYGQIATCKLDKTCNISLPMNIIRHEDREKIMQDKYVRYIYYSSVIGNELLTDTILKHVINSNKSIGEMELISSIPSKFGLMNISVAAAKQIAYNKRLLLINSLYPVIKEADASPLEHSIIRQESLFRKTSVSSAGAIGMMQLMPETAKSVAKRLSINYSDSMLYNAAYNIKLGKHHFYQELKDSDNSLVVTIASYNAGRQKVNNWINLYGDPRKMQDYESIIDWIELIPYGETREYVQRVMEGLQVYKKIINNNSSRTNIISDITSKYQHEYDNVLRKIDKNRNNKSDYQKKKQFN